MKYILPVIAALLLFIASSHADEKRYNIPLANSPSRGPSDAAVTIVEFIDFQ